MATSLQNPLSRETRLPRYRRAVSYPEIRIGRPKHNLLTVIGRLHYASAPQLARLLYSTASLTFVENHLKDLFHAGYAHRLFLPTITPHGSSLAIYALDTKGYAYLKRAGLAPKGRFHAAEQSKREWLFLRHALAVNDILIAARLLPRKLAGIALADFRTERELKRTPIYIQLEKERVGIAPDAWTDMRIGDLQLCVAWELDRGTVERKPFQKKITALTHFAEGPYQQAFGTDSLTVAFVSTAGPERQAELLRWAEAALTAAHCENWADLFRFSAVEPGQIDPADLFLAARFRRPFDEFLHPLLSVEPAGL